MTPRRAAIPLEDQASAVYSFNVPWVESPFFYGILAQKNPPAPLAKLATEYHENGYCILEDLLSPDLCDQTIEETRGLYNPHLPDGPRSYYRAQDAWHESASVKKVATLPRVLELLEFFYDRKPVPFQTLNFRHGTQQAGHSDSIHFSSLPARYMCGAWVALEDVTVENGPLFYYPGSHKLPELDLYQLGMTLETANYSEYERALAALVKHLKLEPKQLTIKKGSGLIWASNLIHGGSHISKAGATRWSQVSHYYFRDCIYYTPFFSNRSFGEYLHRPEVVDIGTGERVKQTFDGTPFEVQPAEGGRVRFVTQRAAGAASAPAATPGQDELNALRQEIQSIKGSRSYRVGRALGTPVRVARQVLSQIRR